jgi:hypothetical protein
MVHRHLEPQRLSLAAIDDIVNRGSLRDWLELRQLALADRLILENIRRVCSANASDPYAQRYHFWLRYAEEHLA